MSACTKFKITLVLSGRYQCFTGKNATRNLTTGSGNGEPSIDTHVCSKNDENLNCFASGTNAKYLEYLFSKWIKDYTSVHKSWHDYFSELWVDSGAKLTTKTIKAKPVTQSDQMAEYVNLFAKLDESTAPKSVEAVSKTVNKPNKFVEPVLKTVKETDKSLAPNSSGESNRQVSDTVIGHIILTPRSEDATKADSSADKPIGVNELIEKVSKNEQPATHDKLKNKIKPETEKPIEPAEYLNAIELVKARLKLKEFSAKRDEIKAQLEIINNKRFQKSLERQKLNANDKVVNKSPKSTEQTRK